MAYNQLMELMKIIAAEVDKRTFERILKKFRHTIAYESNSSFRETVERMLDVI